LVSLSGGMFSSADSSRIIVTRFVGDKDSIVKIILTASHADSFALEKDDMIMVSRKSEYRPIRQVKISGEVKFPGVYSIQDTKTRLIDIIELAGGLTENAYWGGSKIIRKNFMDVGGNEQKKLASLQDGIQITPDESNFLKYGATNKTKISINFANFKMNDNSIANVILKEDDEIYIEKNDWTINVMGAVVCPGLVDFAENKNLNYYISLTGGYKDGAMRRKVKIIKAGTEVWLNPNQVDKIEQGDAIWVPEKDYVSKMETQQSVSIAGGVLGVVGSIATVITAAITVISFIQK
jgi:protein involved in polysaccharide export with SLBB domain